MDLQHQIMGINADDIKQQQHSLFDLDWSFISHFPESQMLCWLYILMYSNKNVSSSAYLFDSEYELRIKQSIVAITFVVLMHAAKWKYYWCIFDVVNNKWTNLYCSWN